MNISDSERIAACLESYGHTLTADINAADLVVFNTCGVRQMAEDRVYGQIHNLKTRSPKPVTIILTGCLANRKDVQKRLNNKVDLFCEIKDFPEKIKNLLSSKITKDIYNRDYLAIVPKYANDFSAFVPIMTGCNNFCAYCVVPYARGREVSRPHQEILAEIRNLIKKDFKCITLLGQNVNSYADGKVNFSQLLKKINALPGKFWIQFVSSHPKDVSAEFIETVAKCKKVCECVHLPIQAGSDEIITKMNRKYTVKHYLSLVKKIQAAFKKYKPGVLYALTTDIIVGFPGETRKHFLKTAEVMKKIPYDMVFFGQYSPRPGTAAWKMKDTVSKKEKERREKFLNEILKESAFANNKKYAGKILEVLVESKKNNFYFGKTRTMKNVKFSSAKKDLVGKFVKVHPVESSHSEVAIGEFHRVKITSVSAWNLEGESA